jgi:hypothetical protein
MMRRLVSLGWKILLADFLFGAATLAMYRAWGII